jgi:hypothetical protein
MRESRIGDSLRIWFKIGLGQIVMVTLPVIPLGRPRIGATTKRTDAQTYLIGTGMIGTRKITPERNRETDRHTNSTDYHFD